ncbi:MAG: aminopeptidase P family protein [Candidatus Coatesbacteria bacterium]|nr:MAG: aminopeptidase P family protein [Candidatus Coatesbacteria bacterium]
MAIDNRTELRRRLFREKRAQLEEHLATPLLLYWGKWEGPNIRALTLAEEFTRPTFVVCRPGGETTAFVQRIEEDGFSALADEVDVVVYASADELNKGLEAELKNVDRVAVEASRQFFGLDRLPPAFYEFVSSRAQLAPCEEVLIPFRAVKSPTELALMKKASEVTLEIFEGVAQRVRPGVSERELADFILCATIEAGAAPAFPPIVASGPRSRHPHPERCTERELAAGDRLIIDCGADVAGYKADVTRTYIAGGDAASDPYYDLSLRLAEHLRAADFAKVTPRELGEEIAALVQEAGLRDRERHGYGHGLGVETHDPHPYIMTRPLPWLERPFEEGMVFTFEPGFYDDKGGFRLEDDYVVWGGRAVPFQEFEPPGGG